MCIGMSTSWPAPCAMLLLSACLARFRRADFARLTCEKVLLSSAPSISDCCQLDGRASRSGGARVPLLLCSVNRLSTDCRSMCDGSDIYMDECEEAPCKSKRKNISARAPRLVHLRRCAHIIRARRKARARRVEEKKAIDGIYKSSAAAAKGF